MKIWKRTFSYFDYVSVALLLLVAVIAAGFYTETRQDVWLALRTAVAADDTALDGTTSGYTFAGADLPSTAVEISPAWNTCDVYFYGTDAADETCNYIIYCKKSTGPILEWCNGAFTLGAGVTGATNTFFADTITTTAAVGAATQSDSTDKVALLHLGNMKGVRYVYCEIDIPAASQVASASAMITGY